MDAEESQVSSLQSASLRASHDLQQSLIRTNSAMNRRAAERYPEQYRAAKARYPAPVDC